MLSQILPQDILEIINSTFNLGLITEIRIRNGFPIIVAEKGRYFVLKSAGRVVYASLSLIDYCLAKASEYSLYAFQNQIQKGYITCKGGIRIGLAGETVFENGKNKTIKNISSLNIRVPHEIKDCSLTAMNFILSEGIVKNTLIISPPGCGKTTFLRDISRKLCELNNILNIFIIDERFEIASHNGTNCLLNVGEYTDVISGCDKAYGFREGVRTLRPDVIITDELATKSDIEACEAAIMSGIRVLASAHADCVSDLRKKGEFNELIAGNYFDRFVVLSQSRGPGTVESVQNEKLDYLYMR